MAREARVGHFGAQVGPRWERAALSAQPSGRGPCGPWTVPSGAVPDELPASRASPLSGNLSPEALGVGWLKCWVSPPARKKPHVCITSACTCAEPGRTRADSRGAEPEGKGPWGSVSGGGRLGHHHRNAVTAFFKATTITSRGKRVGRNLGKSESRA